MASGRQRLGDQVAALARQELGDQGAVLGAAVGIGAKAWLDREVARVPDARPGEPRPTVQPVEQTQPAHRLRPRAPCRPGGRPEPSERR